jgi:hypothetical protein
MHIIKFSEEKDEFIAYDFEATDQVNGQTEYMVTLYVNFYEIESDTILVDNEGQVHDHGEKMYQNYLEYIKP